MLISYNWLQSLLSDELPKVEELAHSLTHQAYEVEAVEKLEGDYILDIDVLPNRAADSLSHQGVAREVSALFGLKLKKQGNVEVKVDKSLDNKLPSLEINTDKLRRAMKRVVGVEVSESPDWIKQRLSAMGKRSINNVVDITNIVMYETGQPVHAFDLEKVTGKVEIREARAGEIIEVLDGEEYELQAGMLMIADEVGALDIAGIKGGAHSGIDENTTHVLFSACNFDPTSVRSTSQQLGLRTDASKRFENNPSPTLIDNAHDLFIKLIQEEAAANLSEGFHDWYPQAPMERKIKITHNEIEDKLGVEIDSHKVVEILESLFCEVKQVSENYEVKPPVIRQDLNISIDLVEEVGRIYGYEHVVEALPKTSSKKIDQETSKFANLRNFLVKEGCSEVYTYSFQKDGGIKVKNPVASDKSYLRDSLEAGLKQALSDNEKNLPLFGEEQVKIFEIGHVFTKNSEIEQLGVAVSGDESDSILKELSAVLSSQFSLSAEIIEGKILLVDCGELSSLASSDIDKLLKTPQEDIVYTEPSVYPFVLRDIAVWVPTSTGSGDVANIIEQVGGEWLMNVNLFDTYEKEDKVSYAFKLVFQSVDKTLSDEEVNDVMKKITSKLERKGFKVR